MLLDLLPGPPWPRPPRPPALTDEAFMVVVMCLLVLALVCWGAARWHAWKFPDDFDDEGEDDAR